MDKFFYFRSTATAANDDDADGSLMFPVSAFRGMVMGTAAVTGVITEDDDAFSMFFDMQANTGGSSADDAEDDNVDVIVVAITTDNNAKAVMRSIVDKINEPVSRDNGFIVVYDGVDSEKIHSDIEGITVLVNAND